MTASARSRILVVFMEDIMRKVILGAVMLSLVAVASAMEETSYGQSGAQRAVVTVSANFSEEDMARFVQEVRRQMDAQSGARLRAKPVVSDTTPFDPVPDFKSEMKEKLLRRLVIPPDYLKFGIPFLSRDITKLSDQRRIDNIMYYYSELNNYLSKEYLDNLRRRLVLPASNIHYSMGERPVSPDTPYFKSKKFDQTIQLVEDYKFAREQERFHKQFLSEERKNKIQFE
jgi:hypothetical protein